MFLKNTPTLAFSVNFTKFLRAPFLHNTYRQLMPLNFLIYDNIWAKTLQKYFEKSTISFSDISFQIICFFHNTNVDIWATKAEGKKLTEINNWQFFIS